MAGTNAVEPPATDAIWNLTGDAKRAAVQAMFSEIAPRYDGLNRLMSLSRDQVWRAEAVRMLQLEPGQIALDLCTGTGDFLPLLRQAVGASGTVIGLDLTVPMLSVAARKFTDPLVQADAIQLPVGTAQCDAVTVGWGIRNVPDIDAAHREIARVLRSGGRFVSIDMAMPRSVPMRALSRFLFKSVVPRLGAWVGAKTAYTYLPESTERFWTREQLADSMRSAGFSEIVTQDRMFGNICIHYGRKA
ncbi:MAG: ubiquinone/menaquinone biosynthesis methyltransferase [Fimbriimonadaceae bacterium]|nr:ubiquinone/menaquinone biosynthesis methyltransferase [Fimbriimonadaceae bacterium]